MSTVTDQTLTNEIQYTLLETPNSGASYGSGLYTVAEVMGRLNYRADLFNKVTNAYMTNAQLTATSGSKLQDLSGTVSNFIDVVDVFYSSNAGSSFNHIPKGSTLEGDKYLSDPSATVTIPYFFTLDTANVLSINFIPAPTFSNSDGQIKFIYIARLGLLPAAPNGTALNLADDFTPFIKYGALADLFMKSGETYDPARASICEALFQLGVEVTRSWLSGS